MTHTQRAFAPLAVLMMISFLFVLPSCSDDDPEERAIRDREKILEYLDEHGLEADEHESGIFIIVDDPGTGEARPKENSIVKLNYKGYLLDGEVFIDRYQADISLQQQVRGLRLGIMEFGYGGKGTILIPSALGFGQAGALDVPRNAVIIYDIEIIDFS